MPVSSFPERILQTLETPERRKFSSRLLRVCSESLDGMISRRRRQTKSSMSSAWCVCVCAAMNDSWEIYSALNIHRVQGVNSLNGDGGNIRALNCEMRPVVETFAEKPHILIEDIPETFLPVAVCSFGRMCRRMNWKRKKKQQRLGRKKKINKSWWHIWGQTVGLLQFFNWEFLLLTKSIYYSLDEQAASGN